MWRFSVNVFSLLGDVGPNSLWLLNNLLRVFWAWIVCFRAAKSTKHTNRCQSRCWNNLMSVRVDIHKVLLKHYLTSLQGYRWFTHNKQHLSVNDFNVQLWLLASFLLVCWPKLISMSTNVRQCLQKPKNNSFWGFSGLVGSVMNVK